MKVNPYLVCKNCINCVVKKENCRCKEGYWKDIAISKIATFTAYDFDCVDFESSV